MRRRLNLSIDDGLYFALQDISSRYNFNGSCDLAVKALRKFARDVYSYESNKTRRTDILAEKRKRSEPTIHDEIAEEFREYSEYEPTPSNTLVPQQHRRRNK